MSEPRVVYIVCRGIWSDEIVKVFEYHQDAMDYVEDQLNVEYTIISMDVE